MPVPTFPVPVVVTLPTLMLIPFAAFP